MKFAVTILSFLLFASVTMESNPGGKHYVLVKKKMTWNAAARHCQTMGDSAHLVAIRNAQEQEAVTRYLHQVGGRTLPECRIPIVKLYLWTAGQRVADSAKKSRFVWKVKTRDSKACTTNSMTYTHWLPCEPNSVHGNEACLALQPRGKDYGWNDVQCHYSACFICEMPEPAATEPSPMAKQPTTATCEPPPSEPSTMKPTKTSACPTTNKPTTSTCEPPTEPSTMAVVEPTTTAPCHTMMKPTTTTESCKPTTTKPSPVTNQPTTSACEPPSEPSTMKPTTTAPCHTAIKSTTTTESSKPSPAESKPKAASRRYKLVTQHMNWHAAQRYCQSQHQTGHLVAIRNAAEQTAVEKYLRQLRGSYEKRCKTRKGTLLWTAGQWQNPAKKSSFVWKVMTKSSKCGETSEMTYRNWNRGEPNNRRGNEACVEILAQHRFLWNDDPCSYRNCFVCEMEA